jgi:hypothetical protein
VAALPRGFDGLVVKLPILRSAGGSIETLQGHHGALREERQQHGGTEYLPVELDAESEDVAAWKLMSLRGNEVQEDVLLLV